DAFDWIGTRDPSPWFTFETAARLHDAWGGEALMADNRLLAAEGAHEIAGTLQAAIAGPAFMRGSMAALRLKENYTDQEGAAVCRRRLASEHRIMAPIHVFASGLWLRISAQIYNSPDDYRRVAAACQSILA